MQKKLEYWKKGNGEIIAFAVTMPLILTLFLYAVALFQIAYAYSALNKAAQTTSRAAAICTRRSDADTQAQRVAESCITLPYLTNIQTEIEIVDENNFAEGMDWGMGQVIKVTVSGDLETVAPAFINGRYKRSYLTTIEGGGAYLGLWRITEYCPCFICNGGYTGGPTASGRWPTPNHTIAMDKRVMRQVYHFDWGDRFLIDGHIYTLEDNGDSNMANTNGGKCIDIFRATHAECDTCEYMEVFYVGHE